VARHGPERVEQARMFRSGIQDVRSGNDDDDPRHARERRDLIEHHKRRDNQEERREGEHRHGQRDVRGLQGPERERGPEHVDGAGCPHGIEKIRAEHRDAPGKGDGHEKNARAEKPGGCQQVGLHRPEKSLVDDIVCRIGAGPDAGE